MFYTRSSLILFSYPILPQIPEISDFIKHTFGKFKFVFFIRVFSHFKILVLRFFWKNPSFLTPCHRFLSAFIPMYLSHFFPPLNNVLCPWNSYLCISFVLRKNFLKYITSIQIESMKIDWLGSVG